MQNPVKAKRLIGKPKRAPSTDAEYLRGKLLKTHKSIITQQNSALTKRKNKLSQRIKSLEDDIKTFCKEKVFLRRDDLSHFEPILLDAYMEIEALMKLESNRRPKNQHHPLNEYVNQRISQLQELSTQLDHAFDALRDKKLLAENPTTMINRAKTIAREHFAKTKQ